MRLFLSSYRAGKHEKELVNLFGLNSRVAVINNAKDDRLPEERKLKLQEVTDFLSRLSFITEELDLRDYSSDDKDFRALLSRCSAVWCNGGNTFILARALKRNRLGETLTSMIKANKLAYGGESAGAIIATPSLHGTEFGDSPNLVPQGYDKKIVWDGLSLVPFHIVPHFKSDWFGVEADQMKEYMEKHHMVYKSLTDDQAIIINGDEEEFLE